MRVRRILRPLKPRKPRSQTLRQGTKHSTGEEDKTGEITEVLRRGITTEKSVTLQGQDKYTFEVALRANKIDVRRAVEAMFNVKVVKVNMMRMPGKVRMIRRK